jgi:hypothetical protein
MGSIGVVCLFALPLVLLAADGGHMELCFAGSALACLIVATVLREVLVRAGLASGFRVIALIGLALLVPVWVRFWILDLSDAKFRSVVVIVPALAAFVFGATRIFDSPVALSLAIAAGLGALWPLLVLRSDVGCVGISKSFDATIFATGLVVYALGPFLSELAPLDGRIASPLRTWIMRC